VRWKQSWFGLAVALCAVAAPAVGPLSAAAASGVDLQLYYDTPVIAPGGTGTQTFGVTDAGTAGTGPAELDLALPAYVKLTAALPTTCQIRYDDLDAAVPEIVRCDLGVPAAGRTVTVALPLEVDAAAPAGSLWGSAIAWPGPADSDPDPADAQGPMSVVVNGKPAIAENAAVGHAADLYVSTDLPPLSPAAPRSEHFTVGNRGPDSMAGPADLVLTPPPLVRVDPAHLPAGCAFLFDDPDPALPQLLQCALPRHLAAHWQEVRAVPLTVRPGAPVQTVWGTAEVYPDRPAGSADTDPLPQNNLVESGAQIVG
jgi:hypothetical protein